MSPTRVIDFLLRVTGTDRAPQLSDIVALDPAFFDRAISEPEAAELIGCLPSALQVRRSRGGGPRYVKVGKTVTYRTRDVIDWLADQRVDPAMRRSTSR